VSSNKKAYNASLVVGVYSSDITRHGNCGNGRNSESIFCGWIHFVLFPSFLVVNIDIFNLNIFSP